MTDLVYSADRVGEAQALLTHQLTAKDVLDALVAADVQQSQDIEDAVAQLRARLDIDTQEGAQLDAIGALVGQPRQGRQDPEYRLWLKARIRVNRSSGSPKDIYAIAYILLGAGADLFLKQIPVGHALEVGGEFPAPDVVAVQRLLQEATAAGVPHYQQFALAAYDRFELAAGSTPVAMSANGYDNGRLVDWIGPEQTPDPYALIEHTFGRRLVDCWDCRQVEYDDIDQGLRVVGATSELQVVGAPARAAKNVRGQEGAILHITSDCFVSQRAALRTMFEGSNAWTVGLHFVTSPTLSTGDVLTLSGNATAEITPFAGVYLRVFVSSTSTLLEVRASAANFSQFSTSGHGFGTTPTAITLVMAYDGAGTMRRWQTGSVVANATATHRTLSSLNFFTWGGYDTARASTDPWQGYKLAVFDRVLTDTEAQRLIDTMDREFTDNAYY